MTETEALLLDTLKNLEALYQSELTLLRNDLETKEKQIGQLVEVCQMFKTKIEELSSKLTTLSANQVEISRNQIDLQQVLAKTIKR